MTEATGLGFPQHIFAARPPYADAPGSVPMGTSETINAVIYGFLQIAIWLWHAIAGFQASKIIAIDSHVENWVKNRYRLIVAYSCLQALVGVIMMVRPFVSSTIAILSLLLVIATTTMQYLVWVMPERFRLWLNREQQARPAQEEQLPLSVLDVFGAAMTAGTGLKSMACLYAIRTTASKRIGSENSAVIQKYLNEMTYAEWEAILQHSELRRILINSGADDASATKAIENARQALVEKQSLLTLGAR